MFPLWTTFLKSSETVPFNLVNLLKVWFRSQIHNISALIIFFICTPNPRDWGEFLLVWMLLPEGPESDEIFDQTQKPNKGPSIRRDEHHIGHTGGYKEIKKLQQRNGRNQNWGTLNLFVCLPQLESVCLCLVSPGWRVCWMPEEEVTIVNLCERVNTKFLVCCRLIDDL